MREKERIMPFMYDLAKIWEENCPDWRFGQLMINVLSSFDRDPFFIEEDEMLDRFKKFFNRKDADEPR